MAEEKKTSKKSEKADKAKDKKKKSKKNPFKSIASFFKSVRAEGKKVVWAEAKDVLRNTIIVLVVVTIVGACIYGVDTLLSLGMKGIKNLAETEVSEQVSDDTQTSEEALQDATEDADSNDATE